MRSSSDSIAALATALASAQAELVNPQRSMVATIPGTKPGERERSFRYAPLCGGLDIVRTTLGRHEIATVQTTAIDTAAGLVNLTTTLAHSSGEWVSSEWPVCPVADIASPQRMGCALTYARRYALFTLVGIAGEDDIDAPDLRGGPPSVTSSLNGGSQPTSALRRQQRVNGRLASGVSKSATYAVLSSEQSAALRDRLVGKIASLTSTETAASWAQKILTAKSSLTDDDCKCLEDMFQKKLSELLERETSKDEQAGARGSIPAAVETNAVPVSSAAGETPTRGIDKSALTISEPRRHRSKAHLRFVARQACLICGRRPSDAHHLGFTQPRALGRKVSDEFTVPLCRIHHRASHRARNERAWWQKAAIDPIKVAREL